MNKQDEEKAMEIADKEEYYFANGYSALMQMAAWKEKQMIKETCRVLESLLIGGVHPQGIQGFIKQFKQAMKGE